ncbi:MAG TPA: hypothetical protein VHZ51_07480 [Ktedonobacteraceae bacterium]|nr:hypothetical protein [Ktedonobacteraceae bacterium]
MIGCKVIVMAFNVMIACAALGFGLGYLLGNPGPFAILGGCLGLVGGLVLIPKNLDLADEDPDEFESRWEAMSKIHKWSDW